MKIFWFDVETTGLNPEVNDIIQLGYVFEIDGKEVESGELFLKPLNFEAIDERALQVNGITRDRLEQFPEPCIQFSKMKEILGNHIDKYDRNDKAYVGGYNVGFDYGFLSALARKCGDRYGFGSFLNHVQLDPLSIINVLHAHGKLPYDAPNRKLVTMCNVFGVDLEHAHDAVSDVKATRKLYYKVLEFSGLLKSE